MRLWALRGLEPRSYSNPAVRGDPACLSTGPEGTSIGSRLAFRSGKGGMIEPELLHLNAPAGPRLLHRSLDVGNDFRCAEVDDRVGSPLSGRLGLPALPRAELVGLPGADDLHQPLGCLGRQLDLDQVLLGLPVLEGEVVEVGAVPASLRVAALDRVAALAEPALLGQHLALGEDLLAPAGALDPAGDLGADDRVDSG